MNTTRHSRHQRGIALIMVLVLVAMLSVMTWAMVYSATIRSQVNNNAADIVQAQYLAESGASLAAFYLQNEPATGVVTNAATGDRYWSGMLNTMLWADAIAPVDITVTNPSQGKFMVTSVARLNVGTATISPGVRITVQRTSPSTAYAVPTGVVTNSSLSTTSFPVNGGSTVASGSVPAPSQLTLVQQLGQASPPGQPNLRPYNINGQSGFAQKITVSNVTSNWPAPTAGVSNPLNIWWTDANLIIGSGSLNQGTLVMLNQARLLINNNATFNACVGLPAIIATGDLHIAPVSSSTASFSVNGVVYVGGQITGNSQSSSTNANLNGALLFNGTATSTTVTNSNRFRGVININYAAGHASLNQFSSVTTPGTSTTPVVRVTRWENLQ
jgi:Tfp pilus assembly protein PilX